MCQRNLGRDPHKPASIPKSPKYRPNNCNCGAIRSGYVGGKLTNTRMSGAGPFGIPTTPFSPFPPFFTFSKPGKTSPSSHKGIETSYRILSPGVQMDESNTASVHS